MEEELEEKLAFCCSVGFVEHVKQLLNNPTININRIIDNRNFLWRGRGKTPLYIACARGRHEVVKLLLEDPRIEVNALKYGPTPLCIACQNGHREVVKLLLDDQRVEVDERPLLIACAEGHTEVVKLLLNYERVCLSRATTSHFACHCVDTVKLLIDDIDEAVLLGATPLYIACQNRQFEVVKLLLNENVDVFTESASFLIACQQGYTEIVKLLANDPRIDINNSDNCIGATPFFAACQNGHIEIVKFFLNDERIDVNKTNEHGNSPLLIACYKGHLEVVKHILASEKPINLNAQDWFGQRSIDIARERCLSVIEEFESVEDYERRITYCPEIINLLESFEKNPIETKIKLKKQLGLLGNSFFFLHLLYFFIEFNCYIYFFQINERYQCSFFILDDSITFRSLFKSQKSYLIFFFLSFKFNWTMLCESTRGFPFSFLLL